MMGIQRMPLNLWIRQILQAATCLPRRLMAQKKGNDKFFVHINTTTIVVKFIHKDISLINLRHGTLSVIILLYVRLT